MCLLGEKDRRIRRSPGGVPAQVSLEQIRTAALNESMPDSCRIGRLQRMQFPAFKSIKGIEVLSITSGQIIIDLDKDHNIRQAIWIQIGGGTKDLAFYEKAGTRQKESSST